VTSGSQQSPAPGYVAVGLIIGPWGRVGDLKVRSLTDFPERFAPGRRLYAGGEPYTIEHCQWRRGYACLKFSGIDSTTAAEALRQRLLEVPESELMPLAEGEYYHFQILGLEVRSTGGEILGTVAEVISTGSNDVFLVQGPLGELLIPGTEDVIKSVDLEAGRMEIEMVEGLRPPPKKSGRQRIS
jgi:16S rRNA processing protein RimM